MVDTSPRKVAERTFTALMPSLSKEARRWKRARAVRRAGFWFVDVPRTSSSSIKAELGKKYGAAYGKMGPAGSKHATRELFKSHIPAARMRLELGSRTWDAIYTFSIVRNPFDRVLSLFHHLRKADAIPETWSFPDFIRRLADTGQVAPQLAYFALRYRACDFLSDEGGDLIVDDVYRFEDRTTAIHSIGEKIGFPELGQLHINKGSPKASEYRSSYDRATRDLVEKYYARDLELFDYDF